MLDRDAGAARRAGPGTGAGVAVWARREGAPGRGARTARRGLLLPGRGARRIGAAAVVACRPTGAAGWIYVRRRGPLRSAVCGLRSATPAEAVHPSLVLLFSCSLFLFPFSPSSVLRALFLDVGNSPPRRYAAPGGKESLPRPSRLDLPPASHTRVHERWHLHRCVISAHRAPRGSDAAIHRSSGCRGRRGGEIRVG